MAYVSTKAENSNIANVAGMFNGLWIGLFSDVWMWSDGRETSFRYWLSGSPDLGDCASVAVSQQGRWIGADCNQKAVFACQGGELLKCKNAKIILRHAAKVISLVRRRWLSMHTF